MDFPLIKNVELNNQEFLDDLKIFEQFVKPDIRLNDDLINKYCNKLSTAHQEHYTNKQYLQYILNLKDKHDGFPEIFMGYSLASRTLKFIKEQDFDFVKHNTESAFNAIENLQSKYCLKNNALFAIYPPGGYISWHNNANASAHNLILTWSETGEGDFSYLDREKSKLIKIKDLPGWQCKVGYFGSYSDPPKTLLYHSAKTTCWRMTISFTFDRSEESLKLKEWIVNDIESST